MPESLAVALAGAYLDRRNIHNMLCGEQCACGIAALLTDLVELFLPGFADAAARLGLEGKPFWPADYPELLHASAPA